MNLSSALGGRVPRASLNPGPQQPGQQGRRRSRSGSRANASPPHNVLDEDQQENAFQLPEVQAALADAKALMGRVADTLGRSGMSLDEASTLYRLQREAAKLAEYRNPESRTVGFMGDSGTGKSSLLNSLLDIQGLARASSGGSACTCVATEYHYHTEPTFTIQVHLLSLSELRDQIQPLLTSYRQLHFHRDQMIADQEEHFEAQAKLAWDTFIAMFRGRLHNDMLLVRGGEDDVLETLMDWAADLRPTHAMRQEGLLFPDCSATLAELSSDLTSSNTPATWPYIKKIQVFSNAHILTTGLVLADLPGLRDLNAARRIITEIYMLRCHEIFAVCKIDRAVTDESLRDVFELAKNARLTNIGVVCTRSEDIRAEEAIRDTTWSGQRANTTRGIMDLIEAGEFDYEANEAKLTELLSFDDDKLLPEEREERSRLLLRKEQISRRRDGHRFQLQQYLIRTRNQYVVESLRDIYGAPSGTNDDIPIFCVSNTTYWSHRTLPAPKALPTLTLSGILDMRRHCLSIVAASQLHAAKAYIEHEVPSVLSQVDLWVQSGARHGSEERREVMRQMVVEVGEVLKTHLRNRRSTVNRVAADLKQCFRDEMYPRWRGELWCEAASEVAFEWSNWHHAVYSAFCRNEGTHSTHQVNRNWNAEVLVSMVSDLNSPWNDLMERFRQIQSDIIDEGNNAANNAINRLDASGAAAGNSVVSKLEIAIETQANLLSDSLDRHLESLESKFSLLRISAMSSIPSSLIRQAMRQPYRDANLEHGLGSHRRRIDIIEAAFGNPDLFNGMMRDFQAAFWKDVETAQADIAESVAKYLTAVGEDLDLVREESVARESERDAGFSESVAERVREGWEVLEAARAAIARQ